MKTNITRKDNKKLVRGNKIYIFNVPAAYQEIIQKKVSTSQLAIKLELVDEKKKQTKGKERTAARIKSYLRGNDESIGINTIQLLGLACKGDKMAFLQELDMEIKKVS